MYKTKIRAWTAISLALSLGAACGDDSSNDADAAARDGAVAADTGTPTRTDASTTPREDAGGQITEDAATDEDATVGDVDSGVEDLDASTSDMDASADASGSTTDGSTTGDAAVDAAVDASTGPALVITGAVVGRLVPTSDSAYITALCGYYLRCDAASFPGFTLADCRALFSQPCSATPNVILNADDGADACVARFTNATCDDDLAADIATGACGTAFDHGVARLAGVAALSGPGGTCGDGNGCKLGSECQYASETAACGQCVAKKAVGASCSPGECLKGGCSNATNKCVAPAAEGQPCVVEGSIFGEQTQYCATGLYCNSSTRCVAQIANGATCSADQQCLSKSCVSNKCATPPLAAGAACSADEACASGVCFDGRCATIGSCDPGLAGEPCDLGSCAAGLFCVAHRCATTAPTDCTTTGCNAGTYCDATQKVCLARKAADASCDRLGQCAVGECQSDGTKVSCMPQGPLTSCLENADCISGMCVGNYCRGGSSCD